MLSPDEFVPARIICYDPVTRKVFRPKTDFDRWKESEERFREGPKFFDTGYFYCPYIPRLRFGVRT